jgi:hypothetical protein
VGSAMRAATTRFGANQEVACRARSGDGRSLCATELCAGRGLPVHVRLCHSRMLFVRAYPREPGDGIRRAQSRFAFFRGTCTRGIYDNLWRPPAAR